jgi:hypothetical protein
MPEPTLDAIIQRLDHISLLMKERLCMHRIILIFSGLCLTAEALAITGNEWKQLASVQREVYVWGVVETWRHFEMENEPISECFAEGSLMFRLLSYYTELVKCMAKKMTRGQITAVVDKYMEENPSQWHHEMTTLVGLAMGKACTTSPQPSGVKKQRR